MENSHGMLKLLLLIMCGSTALATSCPSKNFCHTTEIKYRAFDELPGMYLNSTNHVFKTFMANTSRKCMQECTRTENCKSANYYLPTNQQEMICDLIDGNKWSNASLLLKKGNSTHFFVNNPCSSNPCKTGGTCISNDQEASYTCACINSNHTTTIHGFHCETVKVAEETAEVYFRFNVPNPKNINKPEASHSFNKYSTAKIVHVPDRKSSVLYLPGISGHYASISGFGGGVCPTHVQDCLTSKAGLSISFWFRLTKRSQSKFNDGSCTSVFNTVMESSETDSQRAGFRITLRGCKNDAIRIYIRRYSYYLTAAWGNAYNETLYKSWSHFAFTVTIADGLVMYLNGVEVQRQPTFISTGTLSSYRSDIRFGQDSSGNMEVFMDKVAIWYKQLTPADITFIYQHGLERGKSYVI